MTPAALPTLTRTLTVRLIVVATLAAVAQVALVLAYYTTQDEKTGFLISLREIEAVAAGTGARMALLNRGHRREIEETVRKIEKIETALESKFQEHFVYAMALPNKVDGFPELSKVVTLPERKQISDEAGESGGRRRRRSRE